MLDKGTQVHTKPDRTPLTNIDLELNEIFLRTTERVFPTDGVLGEERSRRADGHRTWVIDPIDGTQQLILGIPTFMISIALVHDGEPVVAVTANPLTRQTYWAAKGAGAFRDGQPLHVSRTDAAAAVVCGAGATITPADLDSDGLVRLSTQPNPRRPAATNDPDLRIAPPRYPWPSVFSGCKIAEGTWDADLYAHTAAHDVAAVCLIVREAGGRVTDRFGEGQRYDRPVRGCILSNGLIHDLLVRHWSGGSRSS